MPTPQLKSIEGVIRSQLKSLGYFNIEIKNDHEQERSFNVIADGNLRKIFLQVMIYFVYEHINSLTIEQIKEIKKMASNIEKEPWAAVMKVNERGELVEDIKWTNLSKVSA